MATAGSIVAMIAVGAVGDAIGLTSALIGATFVSLLALPAIALIPARRAAT
jgi:hypothetical protein